MSDKTQSELLEAWNEAGDLEEIKDAHIKATTAQMLENTANELGINSEQLNESTVSADVAKVDSVLLAMARRLMPSLVAFDTVGVQPMRAPVSQIFAMRSFYLNTDGTKGDESFGLTEPDKDFTGKLSTADGESAGSVVRDPLTPFGLTQPAPWPKMKFEIAKTSVTAETRQVQASYTRELVQDLKALHGQDARTEIANILAPEIKAEMNRELVHLINSQAKVGVQGATAAGTIDIATDTDGRWEGEHIAGLLKWIAKEAHVIARETRRGVGNFIITSANIAASLAMVSKLWNDTPDQLQMFDGIGITYAGMLANQYKVFVDPWAATDYITVGYKGPTPYDAGMIWCPYVPIYRMESTNQENFQPNMGFQTRYGIAFNPFVSGTAADNPYYRTFAVVGL